MNGSGKQSFYEIQLSNSSLIIAFVVAVGLGVAVFMLGVMVGKGQSDAVAVGSDYVEQFASGDSPLEPASASADLQFDQNVRQPTEAADRSPASSAPAPDNSTPVAPAPATASLPAHDPTIANGFVVQVKATGDRSEANALQTALTAAGFPTWVVTGEDDLYRVRVGRYRLEDDAERVAAALSERSDIGETWITQG